MDSKLNFVKDGALHLPPGFRFQPTEEEIVFQYLTQKTYSRPLPASVIPEINNIYNFSPWDLPGDQEQDRYFFSNAPEIAKRSKSKRNEGSGYWRTTGVEKKINYGGKKQYPIMGIRRTLVFREGRKTEDNWIMYEYRLSDSKTQIGNWKLCHLFLKQPSSCEKEDDENTAFSLENKSNSIYDRFLSTQFVTPSSPTSSCSSSSRGGNHMITDITSHDKYSVEDEEESSSCGHGYDCSSTFGDY